MKQKIQKTIFTRIFLCILAFFAFFSAAHTQTVRYVKQNGTGDGSSWTNASGDLQEVINASDENDIIWVAAGIYKPNRRADDPETITPNNRYNSFVLKNGVKIYGSFAGTETSLAERQLPVSGDYTSILSGDFNDDDDYSNIQNGYYFMTENACNVVSVIGEVGAVCLDGFTITGGAGKSLDAIVVNGELIMTENGGGIYAYPQSSSLVFENLKINRNTALKGGGMYCSPEASEYTLTNVTISNNRAEYGGGIYCYSGNPVLNDVIISGNFSDRQGGGIYIESFSPVLTNVTIRENTAGWFGGGGMYIHYGSPVLTHVIISKNTTTESGGGIYNGGTPVLNNVIIIDNTAEEKGGGIYNIYNIYNSERIFLTNVIIHGNTAGSGGGIYNSHYSIPVLTNVSITGNTAEYGGGMYVATYTSYVFTNVTITGNSANEGSGMYDIAGRYHTSKIRNSIIWGNGAASNNVYNEYNTKTTYSYSLVEGVTAEGTILAGEDPLFTDTGNGNFRLQENSPCINAGNNTFFDAGQTPDLSAVVTDLAGGLRIYGNIIDLGAYEWRPGYTVNFEGDNINIDPLTVDPGHTITAPETPIRGGYEFGGWFVDNNTFLVEWNFENNVVTQDTTFYAKWDQITGIEDIENKSIRIYPNPVKSELMIETNESGIKGLEILDLFGKTLSIQNFQGQSVNFSALPKGIYFIKIDTDKGIITKKIIKN